ncbi:MAG: TM2 domain-containing protein [Oscillatoriales cyanobacterium]|nr:MAG: TM2 domain-containing protein [Oscillatoriales cyanobacterium]
MTSDHPPKSKNTAAILCFLLGGLGIHRFYLGHTWIGVVQLLTCGGCLIWSLIDSIAILTGDLKDSHGQDLV